jgi:Tfp pilus assembly protein PilE
MNTKPTPSRRAPSQGLNPRAGAPAFCRLTPVEHSKPAGCRRSVRPGARQRGYLLIEALVYIGVVAALLGVAYAAAYRCIDRSIALRRNADDITSALHAGERWRADVRAAASQVRLENTEADQLLYLDGPGSTVVYRFTTNAVSRRVGSAPWVRLLPKVKSSTMIADRREYVTAWRWELELQPRATGSVKPGRIRPLFTFLAVPQHLSPK